MNIKGNYTVNVLWFFNSFTKNFEKQLPEETQAAISGLRDRPSPLGNDSFKDLNPLDTALQEYPLASTSILNWSPELTTLMSQQASWMVYEAKEDIQAMLAATPGGAAAAKGLRAFAGQTPKPADASKRLEPTTKP